MPDIPIALITDDPPDSPEFDIELEFSDPEYTLMDRIPQLQRTPFEKTLMLGPDTYMYESCGDVFDLLDRFGIAAAQAPARRYDLKRRTEATEPVVEVPDAYPLFNADVIAFRDTSDAMAVLEDWAVRYEEQRNRDPPVRSDQPAFRAACYNGDAEVATLPREYNVQLPFRGYVKGTPKIIHGRVNDPADVAKRLDAVDAGALYDAAKTGSNHRILVDPGKWPRRIEALRLAAGEVGYAGAAAWVLRWLLADDRDGLRPKSIRALLRGTAES